MKNKTEKTKLQLANIHRWTLTAFLAQPGPVGTYARYLAPELQGQIKFTAKEVKAIGLEETQTGISTHGTWKTEAPKLILLDEDERLALLEIVLTRPRKQRLGVGDDLIRMLGKDRDEIKELIEQYEPKEPEVKVEKKAEKDPGEEKEGVNGNTD